MYTFALEIRKGGRGGKERKTSDIDLEARQAGFALRIFEVKPFISSKVGHAERNICLIFAQPIVSCCVFPGALAFGESNLCLKTSLSVPFLSKRYRTWGFSVCLFVVVCFLISRFLSFLLVVAGQVAPCYQSLSI